MTVQQQGKRKSTPVYLPTWPMKPDVVPDVNPDPLLFVFYADDNAVVARRCCVCLCGFGRTYGWLGADFFGALALNSLMNNIDWIDHNNCRSMSDDDIGHIEKVGHKHASAKRLMRAGLINKTVGNCNGAYQHSGGMWYSSIAKSKRCHIFLISTGIISGFGPDFHS